MPQHADIDPVPPSALPTFSPVTSAAPDMPAAWSATALLHPFGPPPSAHPKINQPFYQLCIAQLDYLAGAYFSAKVVGTQYGQWWYIITPGGTKLSTDGGTFWNPVNMGWSLPTNWYGAQAASARSPGAAPLNWMSERLAEWWTIRVPLPPAPVPLSPPAPPLPPSTPTPLFAPPAVAATWMWFDAKNKAPMRMMFGYGPPLPTFGDPTQLAFLQMFSFSYFTGYVELPAEDAPKEPFGWSKPTISGFTAGNPQKFKPFVWNGNSGITAFMTPVNGFYNPLPTRVLYRWTDDASYHAYTDRVQDTLMHYNYNPDQPPGQKPITDQTALLTGVAPTGMPHPPAQNGRGFLYTQYADGTEDCDRGKSFPFGQEPPSWVSIPMAQSTIQGTIVDNPDLCPGHTITIYSVMFPPSKPNYPEATYLWTWYAPEHGGDGTVSRPVTFMQSESQLSTGTSLALADYYYYKVFSAPIDPGNLTIPPYCLSGNCQVAPDDDDSD